MQINTDAKKIKRWREDRSWSQEHLADAAGLSLRTVQRIENGEGASRDTAISLSDGIPGYAMAVPALWWGIGVAGFGLAAIIVEVTAYYQDKAAAES